MYFIQYVVIPAAGTVKYIFADDFCKLHLISRWSFLISNSVLNYFPYTALHWAARCVISQADPGKGGHVYVWQLIFWRKIAPLRRLKFGGKADLEVWILAGRLVAFSSLDDGGYRSGLVLVNLNLGVSLGTKIHEHRLRAASNRSPGRSEQQPIGASRSRSAAKRSLVRTPNQSSLG